MAPSIPQIARYIPKNRGRLPPLIGRVSDRGSYWSVVVVVVFNTMACSVSLYVL